MIDVDATALLLGITVIAGLGGSWACIIRLKAMNTNIVTRRTRAELSILLGGCSAAVMSPFLPEALTGTILALAVVSYLFLGLDRWRHGVPDELRSDRVPLDTIPMERPRVS
jgi:hypothetical protein